MKFNFEETKIYVRPGATDLRKGVTGLLAVIENEMKLNALSDSVFLFCNKLGWTPAFFYGRETRSAFSLEYSCASLIFVEYSCLDIFSASSSCFACISCSELLAFGS